MKLRKITAAALVPAAVSCIALAGCAAAQSAANHEVSPATRNQAQARAPHRKPPEPSQSRQLTPRPAGPVKTTSPGAGQAAHRSSEQAQRRSHRQAEHANRPSTPAAPAAAAAGSAAPAAVGSAAATAAAAPGPVGAAVPAGSAAMAPLSAGMSSFEKCVAWRESGDNPTASSAGLFGILPAIWASLGYQGTAGQSPVALQKAAFNRLFAQDGTQPWAPYDGC